MELNMELVPMKDLETTIIMVHFMESSEDKTAYGNHDGLFHGISLAQ